MRAVVISRKNPYEYRELLQKAGFDTICFYTPDRFLKDSKIDQNSIDIVITAGVFWYHIFEYKGKYFDCHEGDHINLLREILHQAAVVSYYRASESGETIPSYVIHRDVQQRDMVVDEMQDFHKDVILPTISFIKEIKGTDSLEISKGKSPTRVILMKASWDKQSGAFAEKAAMLASVGHDVYVVNSGDWDTVLVAKRQLGEISGIIAPKQEMPVPARQAIANTPVAMFSIKDDFKHMAINLHRKILSAHKGIVYRQKGIVHELMP